MNNLDKQYTSLLQDILDNGIKKEDRTGTGTLSVFGRQIRHKMSEGFPLLTTKKIYFKGVVTELLWFLSGDTRIGFLHDNDCHIWDGDAYKKYSQWVDRNNEITPFEPTPKLSLEDFVKAIGISSQFADSWGDLGPIYGKQWRRWGTYPNSEGEYESNPIDQIQNLINDLKTNPDSRRLMVSAWNVGELDQMVLPPCHYGFQVYTRELSLEERHKLALPIWKEKYGPLADMMVPTNIDNTPYNIPTRAISLMWNQRSVDTFLGLPFNIASYGLLLEIIAKVVNMVPDELIGNLGDTHLYLNHIEQAKQQIGIELSLEEREELYRKHCNDNFWAIKLNRTNEVHYERASIPTRTREPYPLPKLKINSEFWAYEDDTNDLINDINVLIDSMLIEDFKIENYQSHPAIKAPLSN